MLSPSKKILPEELPTFQCPLYPRCTLSLPDRRTSRGTSTSTSRKNNSNGSTSNPNVKFIIEHLETEIDDWIAIEYANIIRRIGANRLIITNINEQHIEQLTIHGCPLASVGVKTFAPSLLQIVKQQEEGNLNTSTNSNNNDHHDDDDDIISSSISNDFQVPSYDEIAFLDMRTVHELKPSDANTLKYVILGGILGDVPPKDRAIHLRESQRFTLRNLGDKQMAVDTAAIVCSLVLDHQHALNELSYIDYPEINTGSGSNMHLDHAVHDMDVAADDRKQDQDHDEENDNDMDDDFRSFADSVELPYRYLADTKGDVVLADGLRELLMKDADIALTEELHDNVLDNDINALQHGIDDQSI